MRISVACRRVPRSSCCDASTRFLATVCTPGSGTAWFTRAISAAVPASIGATASPSQPLAGFAAPAGRSARFGRRVDPYPGWAKSRARPPAPSAPRAATPRSRLRTPLTAVITGLVNGMPGHPGEASPVEATLVQAQTLPAGPGLQVCSGAEGQLAGAGQYHHRYHRVVVRGLYSVANAVGVGGIDGISDVRVVHAMAITCWSISSIRTHRQYISCRCAPCLQLAGRTTAL